MTAAVSSNKFELIFEGGWIKHEGETLEVLLQTQDLELRSISKEDKVHYQALYSDPETMKMFTDNQERLSKMGLSFWKEEQVATIATRVDSWIQRWKKGNPFSAFAIYTQKGEFVGHIIAGGGEKPEESELAYIISSKHWNKKFASQAVDMVVGKWMLYLREQNYLGQKQYITATARADNKWSNRILEKREFVKIGEEKKWGFERNIYRRKIIGA